MGSFWFEEGMSSFKDIRVICMQQIREKFLLYDRVGMSRPASDKTLLYAIVKDVQMIENSDKKNKLLKSLSKDAK